MDQVQLARLTGAGGSGSQSIGGLTIGKTYTIQFSAMQAGIKTNGSAQGTKPQTVRVTLGADSVGPAEPPVDGLLKSFAFAVTAKTTTAVLTLAGTNAYGGDNTAYIDAVFVAEGVSTATAIHPPRIGSTQTPAGGRKFNIRGQALAENGGKAMMHRVGQNGSVAIGQWRPAQ